MTERRFNKSIFSRLATTHGFSMAELLVVMGIFIVVIMISSGAFEIIAKSASKLIKSSDSNIQGVIGLEIMRADLASAGYGLPWTSPGTAFVYNFDESQAGANFLANGINPADFNDTNIPVAVDSNKTPRAVQSAAAGSPASAGELGRDYLVIKSTALGDNLAVKKWSYVEGVGATSSLKEWGGAEDVSVGDRVITLKSATVEGKPYRDLVVDPATFKFSPLPDGFYYAVPAKSGGKYIPPAAYQADSGDIFLVYGVSSSKNLTFPYNRVDYYIKRPTTAGSITARCAPGTGILYRANLNHTGGGTIPDPLLECVADMQVVYSLDTNGDGGVDQWADDLATLSAATIRAQLKEIRVFILAQDGQKDSSYTYPSSTVQVGDRGGRAYDLTQLDGIGTEWRRYRWKVYMLVVSPANINN